MDDLIGVVLLTGMAGLAIRTGAAVARIRASCLETELRHSIIAIGGGVLLAAVSLVH